MVTQNPFNDEVALENARLHWADHGDLSAADTFVQAVPFLFNAHTTFRQVVLRPGFSCLGAKAAFHNDAYGFAVYEEMGNAASLAGLCRDLCHFAQSPLSKHNQFASFIAVFKEPPAANETEFENLLWQTLRQLHQADRQHFEWDKSVSPDPNNPEFSFSFAGCAFYVLGMHANSSRVARTLPWPTLIFNPHEQFERLRNDGNWKNMQKSIRARELLLQGSINPMLSDFGEESEARQYSGRAVPDDWTPPGSGGKCPFAH